MSANRNQKALGVFLIVLGVLFLLVSNRLLWFGWDVLWPTFPLLVGLFLLRVFANRRKPRQLFWGALLAQFGVFFFLFSTHILAWEAMSTLWPAFPLMVGLSLIALSGVGEQAPSSLVVGLAFVVFAIVSFFAESGAIHSRLSEPLVRIWPLVLVGAGILIFLRARREAPARAEFTSTERSETLDE